MSKFNITEKILITSSSNGTINVNIDSGIESIYVYTSSSFTLANAVNIAFTGGVVPDSTTIKVYLNVNAVPTTGSITINGFLLTSEYFNNKAILDFTYVNGQWFLVSNFSLESSNIISTSNIKNDAITTTKIVNNAVTTDKITNSSITSAKLASSSVDYSKIGNDVKSKTIVVPVSLETGEQCSNSINFEAGGAGSVVDIFYTVVKQLSGTDDAILNIKLNNLPLFSVTPTIPASSALDFDTTLTPNLNNNIIKGTNKIELDCSKTTAGGKLLFTINYV